MKTIKTLVDYTKSKKKYQLEKKDYFYIEPIKDIDDCYKTIFITQTKL